MHGTWRLLTSWKNIPAVYSPSWPLVLFRSLSAVRKTCQGSLRPLAFNRDLTTLRIMKNVTGYARILEDDLADVSLVARCQSVLNCRRVSEWWSQHAIITQLGVPRTACPLSPSCPCQRTAAGLQHRLNRIAQDSKTLYNQDQSSI